MPHLTRRSFLKQAAATAGVGATFAIAGTKASGRILGANDTVHIGVAGINGRGQSHMSAFAGMKNVRVTHLIDPDATLHEKRAAKIKEIAGNTPTCFQDIRKALEDKDLDAVSIATCNHWHSLITIWACQAEKDVYVEKPISHNVFEGRKCVEAAEKYKRIVQHGTQSRSSSGWAKAAAAVASGEYGKLKVSKGYASKVRWSIGFEDDEPTPETLDFDLWLGPAKKRRFNRNLVHYNWHWNWDFGNGEIGNQGVHQMDIARWGIPGGTLPKRVISMGGRWVNSTEGKPPYTDQGQTPNMQVTMFDFGDCLLVFEVAGLNNRTMIDGQPQAPHQGRQRVLHDQRHGDERQVHSERHGQVGVPGYRCQDGSRRHLRELHSLRPHAEDRRPARQCGGSSPVGGPLPSGKYLLSPGREGLRHDTVAFLLRE